MISYIHKKEQWYKYFSTRSIDEKYKMLFDMLDEHISDNDLIKDSFGDLVVEFKDNLIFRKKFEKAINIIEKIRSSAPVLFQNEFPYLSNFAVEYYLYKDDSKNTLAHLQPFLETPDKGYDLFIPLFNKIRFYKKNDLVLRIVNEILQPIANSPELISGAEIDLVDFTFYNLIQNYYIALKNGQEPKWQKIEETLKKFDYDDAFFDSELPKIQDSLKQIVDNDETPTFSQDEWNAASQANFTSAFRDLFWPFATYMLKFGDFHFSISQDIWFTFSQLIKKGKSLADFSFHQSDLEDVLGNFFGFLSNKEEIGFALLWGIPYIYDFLSDQHLVTKAIKEQSLNDVKIIKGKLIEAHKNDIWRFDFIHVWERPATITAEEFSMEMEIFHESFIEHPKDTGNSSEASYNNYSQISIFDDIFGLDESKKPSKSKQPKVVKKKKRKQAKKQRQKNRK